VDEQHVDHSDDERLVRASLLAAYPPTRSSFSQRRGEQIIRAAALEELRRRRPSTGSRVAASVAAAFTLLAGTASAAGAALPGHPLYPLKRVIERAMVAVTTDDGDAARLELRFAERRLDEASVATEEPVASSLAENFNQHIDAATTLGGQDVTAEIEQLRRTRSIRGTDLPVDGSVADGARTRRPPAALGRSPEPAPSSPPSASPVPGPAPTPSPSPSPSPSVVPTEEPAGLPTVPATPTESTPLPAITVPVPSTAPRAGTRGHRSGG